MATPKYKLGDKVIVASDYGKEDLRGRAGVVADPGPHLRRTKPRWPATYWKEEARHIYYLIEFSADPNPGQLLAAEIDEQYLTPA
jgi:hypothetical protein